MKKFFWILSILWILALSWCGTSNVVEYNDKFVAIVKECTDANQALYQNYNSELTTLDSIEQSVHDNIIICQWAQEKASKIWNYDGDSSLKDGVVNLLAMEVDYLKKFAESTQFLLITHRKGSMESANTVYGATMQEHGITKLVSMKLDEAN